MLKVLVLKSLEENFIILMCGHFCLLDPGVALFCLEDAEVTQRMESITSLFLFVFFTLHQLPVPKMRSLSAVSAQRS